MALKTDYKDDVFSGSRKYIQTVNEDGTISLSDATQYEQQGDYFGANELNEIGKTVNNVASFETAGGTATAIMLIGVSLEDGSGKTFVIAANNNGSATTINGKPLYRPGGTSTPKLVAGKAVTVWYNAAGGCFFIKASAEGDAVAANVLAGKTFSNDDDTGLIGTMPNNGPSSTEVVSLTAEGAEYTIQAGYHSGLRKIKAVISGLVASVIKAGATVGGVAGTFTSDATATAAQILSGAIAYVKGNKVAGTMANRGAVNQSLPINGTYTIPEGYHDGSGKVTQSITTKSAQTYTPGTSPQAIAAGQYLSGAQTIAGDANLIPQNIVNGISIFGVMGAFAGKEFATGTVTAKSGTTNANYRSDGVKRYDYPIDYFTVTNMPFKPTLIILYATDTVDKHYIGVYRNGRYMHYYYATDVALFTEDTRVMAVSSDRFTLPLPNPAAAPVNPVIWYAFTF